MGGRGGATLDGRPYHPQTQGKIERYHRTLGEWLEHNGPFTDLETLNQALVVFQLEYNQDRPHQGIGDAVPLERWQATPRRLPDPEGTANQRRREALRTTFPNGHVRWAEWIIGLGRVWANTKVEIVDVGHLSEVHAGDQLIRSVVPDPNRSYIPTGTSHGRPRRPRPS